MAAPPTPSSVSAPPSAPPDALSISPAYWSLAPEQLLAALHTARDGLTPAEADQRLKRFGLNTIRAQTHTTALRLLLSQFKSPLVLILIFAAIVSGFVGEWVDDTATSRCGDE